MQEGEKIPPSPPPPPANERTVLWKNLWPLIGEGGDRTTRVSGGGGAKPVWPGRCREPPIDGVPRTAPPTCSPSRHFLSTSSPPPPAGSHSNFPPHEGSKKPLLPLCLGWGSPSLFPLHRGLRPPMHECSPFVGPCGLLVCF